MIARRKTIRTLLGFLDDMAGLYTELGDVDVAAEYESAIESLGEYSSVEKLPNQQHSPGYPGVSKHVYPDVVSFLTTGTSGRYKELLDKLSGNPGRPDTCSGCSRLTGKWGYDQKSCIDLAYSSGPEAPSCDGYSAGSWYPAYNGVKSEPFLFDFRGEASWVIRTSARSAVQLLWSPSDEKIDTGGKLSIRMMHLDDENLPEIRTYKTLSRPNVRFSGSVSVLGGDETVLYQSSSDRDPDHTVDGLALNKPITVVLDMDPPRARAKITRMRENTRRSK